MISAPRNKFSYVILDHLALLITLVVFSEYERIILQSVVNKEIITIAIATYVKWGFYGWLYGVSVVGYVLAIQRA